MNILDIAIAKKLAGGGGGSGTDNYNDLSNLPKINDTTLSGNKSSSALGLQSEINSDSKLASDLVDDTNQDNKFVTSTEKNTWNAKQNAIDADHKLSSSLVSFTTAEAAALASGIDSTKVGQISTNQTNISLVKDMVCDDAFSTSKSYAVGDITIYDNKLYKFKNAHQGAWSDSDVDQISLSQLEAEDRGALAEVVDKGAKNIFDAQTPDHTRGTSIVPLANGGITISCTNALWTQYRKSVSVIPNKSYRFMIYVDNISQGLQNFDVLVSTNETTPVALGEIENIHITGVYHINLTPTTDSINVSLFLNNTETAKTQSANIRVLLCSMAEWEISPAYEPYALPNSDLTYLEAEDRAALAEVVDSGAKNEFEFGEFTPSGTTITITGDAVTISGTAGWAKGSHKFRLVKNTKHIISYTITESTTNGAVIIIATQQNGGGTQYYTKYHGSTSGTYVEEFYAPVDTDLYFVCTINNSAAQLSEQVTMTLTDIMICSQADWNISHAYVPYRPNYDLVAALAKNGGFIDSTLGSIIANADLNSISKTTFAVYNEPANLPSGITGYCYVRTSVFDENSALQELYVIQPNPVSFFRIKLNNSWTVWVQTSNV